MLQTKFMHISCEIVVRWMPRNIYDDKANIESQNGLVPQQAITWALDEQDLCYPKSPYATMGYLSPDFCIAKNKTIFHPINQHTVMMIVFTGNGRQDNLRFMHFKGSYNGIVCVNIQSTRSRLIKKTHSGRMTHICVSNIIIIGSPNGLSPDQRQAII